MGGCHWISGNKDQGYKSILKPNANVLGTEILQDLKGRSECEDKNQLPVTGYVSWYVMYVTGNQDKGAKYVCQGLCQPKDLDNTSIDVRSKR